MADKYPVGVTFGPGGQLAAWQEATGRDEPAVVELGAVLLVGECRMSFRLKPDGAMPAKVNLRELTRKTYKPRSHWHRKPVRGAAAAWAT